MLERFRGSWWPRFAAAVLLELLFYYISSATGHLVLIFFGAAFAAASLGLLQGFFVALLIGVLGFAVGSSRFFLLPVDFAIIFATVYGARHGWLAHYRRAAICGLGVGFVDGLVSYGLSAWLQYPISPSIAHPFFVPRGVALSDGALFFSGVYHALDVAAGYLILTALARYAPDIFLAPMNCDGRGADGVRKRPIRWKLLVNMALVTLIAGGVLFYLVRGIYQQQMIRTYGAVAHNFVEVAAKRRSTASSFRASARFTSTRTTSSAI